MNAPGKLPTEPGLSEQLVGQLLDAAKSIDGLAKSSTDPIAAATGEPPAAPPTGQLAAVPAIDWPAEAREVVDFATESFFDLYPRLREVWTPEKLERTTLRLAAVMEKHNLTFGRLLGKWGPEIMLAVVVVPKIPATYRAVRDTHRELREKAKQQQAGQELGVTAASPPAPAAKPSAPSQPVSSPKPQAEFTGPKPPPDPLNLAARA